MWQQKCSAKNVHFWHEIFFLLMNFTNVEKLKVGFPYMFQRNVAMKGRFLWYFTHLFQEGQNKWLALKVCRKWLFLMLNTHRKQVTMPLFRLINKLEMKPVDISNQILAFACSSMSQSSIVSRLLWSYKNHATTNVATLIYSPISLL